VAAANSTTTFNFPLTFPTVCVSITASFGVPWAGPQVNIQQLSTSQYQAQQTGSSGGTFRFIAIGY
jgi:hypothetical protein